MDQIIELIKDSEIDLSKSPITGKARYFLQDTECHVFTTEELFVLLEKVAKFQHRDTRHRSVEIFNDLTYMWNKGEINKNEFHQRCALALMNSNVELITNKLKDEFE